MVNSKFFRLISTLSSGELKSFYHFVKKRFHGQIIQLRLLDYVHGGLLARYPKTKENYFKKEKVYEHVFKKSIRRNEKSSDTKNLSNALSDLNKWLQDFLILSELQSSSYERDRLLLRVYKKRKLTKDFFSTIKKQQKKLETEVPENEQYFLRRMLLYFEHYYNSTQDKISLKSNEIEKAMLYLDKFYMAAKLKYSCELISRQKILTEETSILLLDEILVQLADESFRADNKILDRYYQLYTLIAEDSEPAFENLKDSLLSDEIRNPDEQHILLTYLTNFASLKIRNKPSKQVYEYYIQGAFTLYQFGLESKAIISDGTLVDMHFSNIINIACFLEQFDWANDFIRDWKKYLPDENREDISNLSLARVLFGEQKFDKIFGLYQKITFRNAYYAAKARLLLLRSFYENEDNEETMFAHCQSFEQSLRRNKILNDNFKKSCLNFCRLYRKLLFENGRKDQKYWNALLAEEYLICRPWLEEKITSYKNAIY
ncbi:MAG: hypothetical protein GY705_14185 [Bacteroidetes bacterium]|nr:hypothetical protein [Bacteroidota bacterium]